MIKQDAIAGIHAIGLSVVNRDPVGVELGYAIRAPRVKRGGFALRNLCTKPYSSEVEA